MSESMQVIRGNTWNERIMFIIQDAKKPLQQKDIVKIVKKSQYRCSNMGIYIYNACIAEYIVKIKYPKCPSFYFHPNWIENGKLRDTYTFNPITKEFNERAI